MLPHGGLNLGRVHDRGSRENGSVIGSARELVEITARIFRTVISGEAYSDLLELWDRNFSSRSNVPDDELAVIETQLASALPLLEEAMRNMVTRDDLVLGVASDPAPACWSMLRAPSSRPMEQGGGISTSTRALRSRSGTSMRRTVWPCAASCRRYPIRNRRKAR